jgi:hypothetical protein
MLAAMAGDDSIIDRKAAARARSLLKPPRRVERAWPALLAAGLLALACIGFAVAMVLAPPLVKQHTVVAAPD